MNGLDTLAGISIGAFLLAVAVKGNGNKLIDLAKRDRGYLQWAIAVGILYYLYSVPELKESMGLLIAGSFIGLGLLAGPKIASEGGKFWQSLQG